MAPPARDAADAGAALLRELRSRPPADVARWALEQARELSAAGARPEGLPVAKLAVAVRTAPQEELEGLVRSAIAGFTELPAQERADSVRLALRGAELAGTAAQGDIEQAAAPPPPLVVNLLKVANSAHLEEVPEETWGALAAAAGAEVKETVRPRHVADVFGQLGEGERSQLTDLLVETKVVPLEQRAAVDEALKPGGHADKLHTGLAWASIARQWAPALLLLPLLECWVAFGAPMRGGGVLTSWLRFDCCLTIGLAAAVAFTAVALAPVVRVFMEDPLTALRRGAAAAGSGAETAIRAALPGVSMALVKRGGAGAVAAAALALCSLFWAALGALLLPVAALSGCPVVAFLTCSVVVGLRLGSTAPLVRLCAYARRHLPRLRSEADLPAGEYAPLRR